MSDTPKTDKIIELIEELFLKSNHKDFIDSKEIFTRKELEDVCDLACDASFIINSIEGIEDCLKTIETANLGGDKNG